MSFTPKPCVKCKWYEHNVFVPGCCHSLFMNAVTGGSRYSCNFVRSSESRCGRDGKYWEDKNAKS